MAMDLAKKEYSTSPEYFIADATIPIATAVVPASAALKAHAPVKLASGKAAAVAATDLSGDSAITELYGITADSVDAADDDVVVYLTGSFFADALAYEEGVDADDLKVMLRNIGIFLK